MKKKPNPHLLLAIKALESQRQEHYSAGRHAAAQGFEFGIRAEAKYQEYTEAIAAIQKIIDAEMDGTLIVQKTLI